MLRADSNDKLSLKDQMKSTGASLFFKSIGREVRPSWSNRIIKDFNDLDYDTPQRTIKNLEKFKNSNIQKDKKLNQDIDKRKPSNKKISPTSKININNLKKQLSPRKDKTGRQSLITRNPETIDLGTLRSQDSKYLGLSPFQFQNTIQGKMERKRNHHLSFQKNRVNRSVNLNPVHYNHNEDIDYSHSRIIEQRKRLKKYHPFDSYLDRRVFEPRDQLDKIFDTERSRRVASPRRMREAVRRFEQTLQRRQSKLSQSAILTYDPVPCIEKLQKKSVSFSIKNAPRQIEFMPQVILQSRGCYR